MTLEDRVPTYGQLQKRRPEIPKLWLTYAWKNNDDGQIDHVIAELERQQGLTLGYDRVQLLAGRRLWEQIDAAITDPATDAWATYVTRESLESEPCQEELAYALDRALRTRGGVFPSSASSPSLLTAR
ncbi:MAG: TIR domain-containing protein [Devosia sp.]|nr:TIR domain-containing protein [Devosia sp.]